MGVERFDADPQNIAHRQSTLITELRRSLDERPLHVPNVTGGIGRLHVTVDELGHPGLRRAGADVIGWNQCLAGGLNESPFCRAEKGGFVWRLREGTLVR